VKNWMLGSAQFGLHYGATNLRGKTSLEEAQQMLQLGFAQGLEGLDCAAGYGDAERMLGQLELQDCQLTTKIACASQHSFNQQLAESLGRLRRDYVDDLLIHDPQVLSSADAYNRVILELEDIKRDGRAKRVGVTVYDVQQTRHIVEQGWIPDVIQIPLNIWNQEFLLTGELRNLKQLGVRVQARSLFLQGVLLAETLPESLAKLEPVYSRWRQFLVQSNMTALSACKSFAAAQMDVDHWILGFEDHLQMLAFLNCPASRLEWESMHIDDPDVVNPSRW